MTTMNFRVEDNLKDDFMKLANAQGITATEIIKKLLKNYITSQVEENGLYSLFLSQDYLDEKEEQEIMSSLKKITKEDMEIAYEEEIEI